jgi:DNA-directed DNA polymerase III PolC
MSSILSNIRKPTRFVGLHSHSCFSTFDGLGYPVDHINFITSEAQGMDAWALTDHGNANGLTHARVAAQKVKKAGKKYRQLNGVEFYFVPSLEEWSVEYSKHQQAVKDAKNEKQQAKLSKVSPVVENEKALEGEEGEGLVIEDEEETKKSKAAKPLWQRYYHLVVIAQNQTGLSNLFALVKKSFKDGFYRFPRIDYKMLKEHGEGLVVSTACVGGYASGLIYQEFPELRFDDLRPDLLTGAEAEEKIKRISSRLENMVDRFTDAVGVDNFFLELQFNDLTAQHLSNSCLIDVSKKTGVPLIVTADSHIPDPELWQSRELYKKLGWIGSNLEGQKLPKKEELKTMLYPKNASQMWEEFVKAHQEYKFYHGNEELVRDAIERTHDIAWQKCEDVWIDTEAKLPKFDTPERSAFRQLVDLCKDALVEEGLDKNQEYVDRLKMELSDVKFLKFENYFLTLHAIFKEASKRCLVGPARGSGGGSLINYLLKITHVDPVEHKLIWERFLGRHRVGWPDVDSDAADRDVFIDVAKELFGKESVIPVSNFNTLKLKSLVKDISKFYGIPFEEVNAVTGPLIDEVQPLARDENTEKGLFMLKHEDCMQYSPRYKDFMEKYPDVCKHIEILFNQNKSVGRHAGGVLIAPSEVLEKAMPLIQVRGEFQTPWPEGVNYRHLEDNGFLKFDFLGLALLRDVQNCIKRILKKESGKEPTFTEISEFFDKHLNCRYNKADDQEVWKHVYHQRRKTGVFQFTMESARKFCEDSKPTNITELAAITSIFRPGPLKANVHKQWVDVVTGKTEEKFEHPIMEDVLKETRGFIVFQESFMILAQKMAGFTPGESDKMRKILVKKSHDAEAGKDVERDKLRKKFIEGAKSLHGIEEKLSSEIFSKIEYFAGYGFNKAHAVAYAFDSYYAAWLHTHYEKDWLATILQSESDNPDGLAKTIDEVKQMGYNFIPADVNLSGEEWVFSEEAQAFVPPLGSVKGIGNSAMKEIIANRPYRSIEEMLYNEDGTWRHTKVNKTCFAALCKIEALSSLSEFMDGKVKNHRHLLEVLTAEKNYDILKKGKFDMSRTAVKRRKETGEEPKAILDELIEIHEDTADWSRSEKISNYIDLTSSSPSYLIFPDEIMKKLRSNSIKSIFDVEEGKTEISWFCITSATEKKTKNDKSFVKLNIIDSESRVGSLRVWGKLSASSVEPYTIWIAEVKKDGWGYSAQSWKLRQIDSN